MQNCVFIFSAANMGNWNGAQTASLNSLCRFSTCNLHGEYGQWMCFIASVHHKDIVMRI